jgi:hypothetical protein
LYSITGFAAAQQDGVVLPQILESPRGAALRDRQRQRRERERHRRQRRAGAPAHHDPGDEEHGDQLDRGGADERRRRGDVPALEVPHDAEQHQHEQGGVGVDRVQVTEEVLDRAESRQRQRPPSGTAGPCPAGMRR